jgi:hypothetical protein
MAQCKGGGERIVRHGVWLLVPLNGDTLKIYVEKLVNCQPKSIVGPFETIEHAEDFIHRARMEEMKMAIAHLLIRRPSYLDVQYHLIFQRN